MQRNAAVLVERLRAHPEVAEVRYPGQGAMVSFIVKEGADAADALCAGVRVIVPATSLGGVETTIERRQKYAGDAHVPPGLLRMSVGIEDVEDLWYDLDANLPGSGRLVGPFGPRGLLERARAAQIGARVGLIRSAQHLANLWKEELRCSVRTES